MTINLSKGANVDLTKEAGGTLTKLRVGLGWDARKGDGDAFDLDASIIGCDEHSVSAGKEWFVYYNELKSPGEAIVHMGDERTGDTEGDDEQILVDLTKLPDTIHELAVAVTIHEADVRGQNFGMVSNAYVRVIDESTGTELARYDLSEDAGAATSVVLGKVYRKDGAFKFKALGETHTTGMQGLVTAYKIA